MSIDAPGAQMQAGKANADEFNYIDTYVEYIAEVILKYDNAIPESKNREQKELQQHKQFEVVFEKTIIKLNPVCLNSTKILHPDYSDKYAFQFIKEINPPPPKA